MNATHPSKPSQRGLILACAILLAITASLVAVGLASIPKYYERVVTQTVPTTTSLNLIKVTNETVVAQAAARGLDLKTFALYNILRNLVITLGFEIIAVLLVWKARGEWFRWFTALVLAFVPTGVLWEFNQVAQLGTPYTSHAALLWPGFLLYLYLFPNGKPVPRWTRWPMGALVLFHFLVVLASVFASIRPELKISQEFVERSIMIILLGLPFILGCQVYRYLRVSTLTERLQTKWVLAGLGFFIVLSLVISSLSGSNFTQDTGFSGDINLLLSLFLPFTIGISVLRYHLFDIDVIIRRTLVYGLLTFTLAMVYFASVIILEQVFRTLAKGTGQSPFTIVISTMAIAVLFTPLRRRIQNFIDRRFYRHKYDAEKALAAFAAKARDEVDMERLCASLVSTVEQTVQPVGIILWLAAGEPQAANRPMPSTGEQEVSSRTSTVEMNIAPDDPLLALLLQGTGVIEIDALKLESAALLRLKEAGIKISTPLISQGELIGVLNLRPRLSEQDYSSDDRRLVSNLASHAAPALRVAQLARQQQIEARQRERIGQELRVAGIVQKTLLPQELPSLPGWKLAAHWQPAREMSGDFYDFLPFPDGRLGLIIGDVSGKGVPAALVMATTRSILRTTAGRLAPPGEVLERANNLLCPDIPAKTFATCLYMILDPVTGCLQYANAGHNLPDLQTEHGVVELRATGMPLGLMPGMTYEQKEVQLMPGNRLLMYSDGLVEAHNLQGELFSTPRLRELMAKEFMVPSGSSSGALLIDLLLASLADFTGPGWEQEDDVTLVTLDYIPGERRVM